MIKNYLKVAWRNLTRNKAHTFINIVGLSVGLTCSLLILLWVQSELDIDAFHKNRERLYTVYTQYYSDHKPIATAMVDVRLVGWINYINSFSNRKFSGGKSSVD